MLTRCKNTFVVNLKNSLQQAYKKANIPQLNDISAFLVDLIQENQEFRIHNRHLEVQPIFKELNALVNLYSQSLKLISKLEFAK